MKTFVTAVLLSAALWFPIHRASAEPKESDVTFIALNGADDAFNRMALAGIEKAHEVYSFTSNVIEILFQANKSTSGRVTSQIRSADSGLQIGVSFFFTPSAIEGALRYPNVKFAVLDDPVNRFFDPPLPNLWSSDFAMEEPSFLAGYLAAATSTSKRIAVYGGARFDAVIRFVEGFKQGALHYNNEQADSVEVIETYAAEDPATSGLEPFSFEAGVVLAQRFIAEGADRIFPAAGAGFFGVFETILVENADHVRLIGVDVDAAMQLPEFANLFLTSATKHLDVAVQDAIQWYLEGGEPGRIYLGTLENGGAGISALSPEVASYQPILDDLASQIISGAIKIELPF